MQELMPFSVVLQENTLDYSNMTSHILRSNNCLKGGDTQYINATERNEINSLESPAYGSTSALSPPCLLATSLIQSSRDLNNSLSVTRAGLRLKNCSQSPRSVVNAEPCDNSMSMVDGYKSVPRDREDVDETMLLLPVMDHSDSSPLQKNEQQAQIPKLTPLQQKCRYLPETCAICLDEFHEKEKVSWSSNPLCFHVFHQECILDWLVMNQKENQRKQPRKRGSTVLLSCPCCRQSFMSTSTREKLPV